MRIYVTVMWFLLLDSKTTLSDDTSVSSDLFQYFKNTVDFLQSGSGNTIRFLIQTIAKVDGNITHDRYVTPKH